MQDRICVLNIEGEEREYSYGTLYRDIAGEYQDRYEDDIILVRFQNNLRELSKTVAYSGTLSFVTMKEKSGRDTYRRSAALLMEAAAARLFPGTDIAIMHVIGEGYYCEFRKDDETVIPDEEMLRSLKERMEDMVRRDVSIYKHNLDTAEAIYLFSSRGMKDKAELIRYRRSSRTNVYELEGYLDYYYGYMLPSCGYIKYFDLEPYQNGFMLMFPGKDTRKVEKFVPSDKLFGAFHESSLWGESLGVSNVGELNNVIASEQIQTLILVQESWMEQKIGAIADAIASDRKKKVILIAGPSSSGKTTFSHRLSVQLRARGLNPHPIAMDDFYVNRADTPRDENGDYDFECLEAIDIPLFNEAMTGLLEGREVYLPVFNFKTGLREYRSRPLKAGPDDVLIIEGIHGLNERLSHDLPQESKFKIYISPMTQLNIDGHNNLSTTDCRILRRMVRDNRTRNTSPAQTFERWASVRRGEEKNIFPFQEEADVMFNSALIYEFSVLKIYAEPLLFSIEKGSPQYSEAKRLLKLLDYFLPLPAESIGPNSILREFIGGSCFRI